MPTFSPTEFAELVRADIITALKLLNNETLKIKWEDESEAQMEYNVGTLLDYLLIEGKEGSKNLGVVDECNETLKLNTTWYEKNIY